MTQANLAAAIALAETLAAEYAKAGKNAQFPTWQGEITGDDAKAIEAAAGGELDRADWRQINAAFKAAYDAA